MESTCFMWLGSFGFSEGVTLVEFGFLFESLFVTGIEMTVAIPSFIIFNKHKKHKC